MAQFKNKWLKLSHPEGLQSRGILARIAPSAAKLPVPLRADASQAQHDASNEESVSD
jgi:hypothetical protein